MKSKHYEDIYWWIRGYVNNKEEAEGLTNQLHYLSIRERRKAIALGVLIGWITFAIILQWAR